MKLETFLKARGIGFEKHSHTMTYTAQGLAQAEHVSGYLVAKPVVVKCSAGFVMCVLPAPKHLDLKRVGAVLGDDGVRMATEPEMAELFPDCELGAEPPIGAMFEMQTVMDRSLKEDENLIMQAGTHTESVKISREEWERACDPTVADIAAGQP